VYSNDTQILTILKLPPYSIAFRKKCGRIGNTNVPAAYALLNDRRDSPSAKENTPLPVPPKRRSRNWSKPSAK
jgi:hypothetical protein